MMCPTFILSDFVGAFIERPRANSVRPYGSFKKPCESRTLEAITCKPLRWQPQQQHVIKTCGLLPALDNRRRASLQACL